MGTNTGTIMTIANSIIGVSVLAMPFCFKECGIVLSILMLVLSSILSRLTCYLLLKAAVMARRRNFEFLAFHIFGPTGKFVAELCIIGFLVGTCIAFFVVVGDLGPAIISTTLDIDNSTALRTSVLIGLAVVVVLPLGLLRNVDSLTSVCAVSIGFYLCLVLKVVVEAMPHLASGEWMDNVHFWRPAGILQCLPIFSMALFCQTQLFEIYDSLPNPSLERMNGAVRAAINLCTCVYISVGFFGYVAFCTETFGGNILMSFKPTLMSDVIKLGFVLSVAVSFPLVIFPCRASLYSLLFRRINVPHHETMKTFIPETKFKCITIFIIVVPLAIGLVIPNIELVLGLVGSTIGVGICVIFPAMAFIFVSTKDTADRVIAQFLLFVGVLILVLGTYATLYAAHEVVEQGELRKVDNAPSLNLPIVVENVGEKVDVKLPQVVEKVVDGVVDVPKVVPMVVVSEESNAVKEKEAEVAVARQEPPQPVEPAVVKPVVPGKRDDGAPVKEKEKEASVEKVQKEVAVEGELKGKVVKVEEVIDKEALKKEDEELADAEKLAVVASEQKQEEVLRKIEKQDEERNKLIQEQNKILKEILKEKIIENDKKKEEMPAAVSNKETIEIKPVENKNVENDAAKLSYEQQKLMRENEIIKEDLLQEQIEIIKKNKIKAQDMKRENFPGQKDMQVNPSANEVQVNEDVPKIENFLPKISDPIQSAYVDDGQVLPNKVQVPNQPIAYRQRFASNENNVIPDNPVSPQKLERFGNVNVNKPMSMKSLIMDGQNVAAKSSTPGSVKIDNINSLPLGQQNVVNSQVIGHLSNELGKINLVDVLKKNVADPNDQAKVMHRDILETNEAKSAHDREKRDTLLEAQTEKKSVRTEDVPRLGEVNEELKESDPKNCPITEKANVEDEAVPLISLKDSETPSDVSLIKVGSRLADPIIDMNKQAGVLEAVLTNSQLNGILPMKRVLTSIDSQPSHEDKDNPIESKKK